MAVHSPVAAASPRMPAFPPVASIPGLTFSSNQMVSDFGDFLRRGGIRTPEEYWNADQDYLKLRLRAELMNLAYGLEAGDRVTTEGDPQVQGAAKLFTRIDALLKPSQTARK